MIAFFITSAIAWALPIIIDRVIPEIIKTNVWFRFLIIISPPWLILLMFTFSEDPLIAKVRKYWLIIWIALLILTLLGVIVNVRLPTNIQGQYSFNPWEVVKEVFQLIWGKLKDIFSSIFGIVPAAKLFVNRNINDSIGTSYVGTVDEYSSHELGVRFLDLRPSASRFFIGDKLVVWADIEGESFTEEINLYLQCFARKGSKETHNGSISVRGQAEDTVSLRMRDHVSVSCTFDTTDWSPGYYDISYAGLFFFETWGYVQYYFAPDELVYDIVSQGLDPAQEAGVSATARPIYTNGPIMLGLPSMMTLPIPIDVTNPERLSMQYGASVQNQWIEGKVASLKKIDLLVPQEFILQGCDQEDISGSKQSPSPELDELTGYKRYSFERADTARANYAYESVTCFLGFEGGDEVQRAASASTFLASHDLVMRSFAAQATYLYQIEEELRVKIE